MIDVDQIKSSYDLRDYARQVLGEPDRSARNYDRHRSPVRDEKDASFIVYSDHYHDFGGHDEHGTIIDFAMLVHGWTYLEAIQNLSDDSMQVQAPVRRSEPRREFKPFPMGRVNEYHRHLDKAMPYFSKRGISEEVARRAKLGMSPGEVYWWKSPEGREVKLFAPRYVIPNFFGDIVRDIRRRVAPELRDAYYEWQSDPRTAQLAVAVEREICDAEGITMEQAEEYIIGKLMFPKYKGETDSIQAIFNADRLARIDENGQITNYELPYVIVTEGEMCALALESQGYYAVAVPNKKSLNLKLAFSNVRKVLVATDNDKAGDERAAWIIEQVGKEYTRRVRIPDGYKDPGEMCERGAFRELHEWLQSNTAEIQNKESV
jgi:DNA primase